MKYFIKSALTTLKDYIIVDVIFVAFLAIIFGIGKDNLILWIQIYSLALFLLMLLPILYSDNHKLAVKEKKPQYNLNPYPLKGFVYGLISMIPFAVIGVLYPILTFSEPLFERIKHLFFNCLLGPVYWIVKLGNESTIAYILALAVIPVIAGISYLAGNLGIYLNKNNKPGALTKKMKNRGANK